MSWGNFRASTGDLAYGDEPGPSQRWDPERFARERIERSRQMQERERLDRGPRGGRPRETSIDERYSDRGRGGRFEERERVVEQERFGRPRRQSLYYEDDRIVESSPQTALLPFRGGRRPSVAEKGYGPPAKRGPARPQFIRRQSSLDTFDRRPMPRYGDQTRDEYRPPVNVPIPLPRVRRSPPRRPSPRRYEERDFEEIRISEPDYYNDEEYHGFRERDTRRSTSRYRVRDSSAHKSEARSETRSEVREEEEPKRDFPRKGKTRMPKRLANKRAVIELGYPFEEEEEVIVILKALGKEQIDEVIKVSEEMGESRTTYKIEDKPREIEQQPQYTQTPQPQFVVQQPQYAQPQYAQQPQEQVIERRTIETISPPPPPPPQSVREMDVMSYQSGHRSRASSRSHARSRRNSSTEREYVDVGESSNSISGPIGALVVPERRKDERSIKAEIKALEAEKKALKYEREEEKERRKAERLREGDYEVARDKSVVRIEKDRKAPNPALVKAMLATLT